MRNLTAAAIILLIGTTAFGQVTIPADSLKKHVYFLADDSLQGRGLSTKSGLMAANYIAGYFKQIGLKTIGANYLHPFITRQGPTTLEGNNVVGLVEGSDPVLKNEYVVLGAHFDHISYELKEGVKVIYNGADDNASGTSAIIEIGRALAANREALRRSVVLVAFDGEESGLIGSGEFVTQNIIPVKNIKMMLSLDMIGRYAESNSLLIGVLEGLKGGDEKLLEIAAKQGITLKKAGENLSGRTDSKSFELAGIPAFPVSSGIIGPYHKPGDDPETLDYAGMEKISGLLYEFTVDVANRESIEPVAKITAQAKSGGLPFLRFGAKANIGTGYHYYPHEFYNGKPKFNAEAGLITQLKITKNLALQPEVLYSTTASGLDTGNFRTHSLTVPVSLVIATRMNAQLQTRFYVNLGGYYRYHFAGSAGDHSLDFDKSFEQAETGVVYGMGVEVMKVLVSVNFKRGLSNIMQNKALGEFTSRATYFSIGYIF